MEGDEIIRLTAPPLSCKDFLIPHRIPRQS